MNYEPRIRQIYFCEFPKDREKPEFSKKRPVVIFSKRNNRGVALVVPITTAPQAEEWPSVKISSLAKDGRSQWAVCNHPTTVSVKRLQRSKPGQPVEKMSNDDFQKVVEAVYLNLPVP